MTTTIYPGIAASILPVLPSFSYYGTSWTVMRASGGGISASPTVASVGTVTVYVIRNKVDAALQALPQTTVYTAPWLVMGLKTVDVRVGDVLVSVDTPTVAFLAVGTPETDFDFLFGPLAPCAVPTGVVVSSTFALLLEDGLTALTLEDGLTALILE